MNIILHASAIRRAVNIASDVDRKGIRNHYVPTPQSEKFVENLADAMSASGGAFSVSGAYGAGKSSLALFAMHQMGAATGGFEPAPLKMKNLAAFRKCSALRKKGGVFFMTTIGGGNSLFEKLMATVRRAKNDWPGKPPSSLAKLARLDVRGGDVDGFIDLLRGFAHDAAEANKAGIALVIDEFNRHLERATSEQDPADLALIQSLAELAGSCRGAFSLLIIHHYALGVYDERFQNGEWSEWRKVRGRFQETTLSNSDQDVADIACSLFQGGAASKEETSRLISEASKQPVLRPLLPFLEQTLGRCFPLHPATITSLSRLSSILGQADRTLIGWITSPADSGFVAAARQVAGGWVFPSALYGHFFGSHSEMPPNSYWAKRVADIRAAHDRFDGNSDAQELLQTIAVIGCLGQGAANESMLRFCLRADFPYKKALSFLLQKSLVIFRRHRGEYCIWGGSDYDISVEVGRYLRENGNISIAAALNKLSPMPFVTARRHFVNTGNARTLPVQFVDDAVLSQVASDAENIAPRVFIYAYSGEIPHSARALLSNLRGVTGAVNLNGLKQRVIEMHALRSLLSSDARLNQDSTALQEVERQIAAGEHLLTDAVIDLIHTSTEWHGEKQRYASLQEAASAVCAAAYRMAFTLHNEMINANKSSGAVTAALRCLIAAMLNSGNAENLGIDKHPSHRLIYDALLKHHNLHVQKGDSWTFVFDPESVGHEIRHVVSKIISDFKNADGDMNHSVNIQSVIDGLSEPPYGVHRHPALILCIVFLLCFREQLELYEEGGYVYFHDDSMFRRMIADPKRFSVSPLSEALNNPALLGEYQSAILGQKCESASIYTVAQSLMRRYGNLDRFALHTRNISPEAAAVRRVVSSSRSPAHLLLRDLPSSLGIDGGGLLEQQTRQRFFKSLQNALSELESATNDMIGHFASILISHFGCATLADAMCLADRQAAIVVQDSRMYPLHRKFLCSLEKKPTTEMWLVSILSSAVSLPRLPNDWSETDAAEAEFALRAKLTWLRTASAALEEEKFGEFIAIEKIRPSDYAIDEENVNHLLGEIKRIFPDRDVESVMRDLNHRLLVDHRETTAP